MGDCFVSINHPWILASFLKLATNTSWRLTRSRALCTDANSQYFFKWATDSCVYKPALDFRKKSKVGNQPRARRGSPDQSSVCIGQFAVPFQEGDHFLCSRDIPGF